MALVELRIVNSLKEDETFKEFKNEDIVLGPKKIMAYIPGKNCLILGWPKDSTIARSASFDKMLLRDVQEICKPLSIKKVFITKRELRRLSDGRPQSNINTLKKIIRELLKETKLEVHYMNDIIEVNDPGVRKLLLNDYHLLPTSGHAGIIRMLRNLKKKYYWTGMQNDITTYVKHCSICQRNKHIKPKRQPMTITSTAESCFEKIFLDLVGPLDESEQGSQYILTLQDELTKFIEAVPLRNKEANTVAKALVENFILKYGVPDNIATDQGTEFINEVFRGTCKLLKIQHLQSTAYHHESIGALENTHKVLGAYLRSYVSEKHTDWDTWLPYYVFCYNTSVHSETEYTPFELVYGRQCKLPSNVTNQIDPIYNYEDYVIDLKHKLQTTHRDARQTLLNKKVKRKHRYDSDFNTNAYSFKEGSLVLLKNENRKKLDPVYIGPYEVISEKGVNCDINYKNKRVTVHKNRLKPFYVYLINRQEY